MTSLTRRAFVGTTAGAALVAGFHWRNSAAAPQSGATPSAPPIAPEEHAARIARLQTLLQQEKVAACLVEAGPSLEYFTGIRWWRSERTTAALILADGGTIVVTPFFEVPSVQESLKVAADVRSWHEDQSPFALISDALRANPADRPLAIEHTTRHFIVDHVQKAKGFNRRMVSGEALVNACRMIKSPAELALMQASNDITFGAIRRTRERIETGMTGPEIMKILYQDMESQGGKSPFALVLLNDASAFPHGTEKQQLVDEGSVILIDTGCTYQGYASDVSRTWIHGEPTARQREIWNTVRRGQEICLETAKIGMPVGDIDVAVRKYYEGLGWAKDYGLPGTSHRTGHGIGMEGHEPPNLMRADRTPLQAGMCFSDEPGIYIPGEFGIRLEDIWHMTDAGPKLFMPLAKSIDDPV